MKIVEALKDREVFGIRVSHGDRWLIWDGDEWIVFEHRKYQRGSQQVYVGGNENMAVRALLDG